MLSSVAHPRCVATPRYPSETEAKRCHGKAPANPGACDGPSAYRDCWGTFPAPHCNGISPVQLAARRASRTETQAFRAVIFHRGAMSAKWYGRSASGMFCSGQRHGSWLDPDACLCFRARPPVLCAPADQRGVLPPSRASVPSRKPACPVHPPHVLGGVRVVTSGSAASDDAITTPCGFRKPLRRVAFRSGWIGRKAVAVRDTAT